MNLNKSIISALAGDQSFLTIPRLYVELMDGSLDGALLLSQIIFWSDKTKRPDGYFYKTYAEWEVETTLSKYKVNKHVKAMKAAGFLETKKRKVDGSPTLHYKLDFVAFEAWLDDKWKPKVKNLTLENAKVRNGKLRNFTKESKETSLSYKESEVSLLSNRTDDYIQKNTTDEPSVPFFKDSFSFPSDIRPTPQQKSEVKGLVAKFGTEYVQAKSNHVDGFCRKRTAFIGLLVRACKEDWNAAGQDVPKPKKPKLESYPDGTGFRIRGEEKIFRVSDGWLFIGGATLNNFQVNQKIQNGTIEKVDFEPPDEMPVMSMAEASKLSQMVGTQL